MDERFLEALKNIYSYKMRAFLTALGIIFGLAAFISMLAIGNGAKQEIVKQISTLGLSNIIIKAKKNISPSDKMKAKSVASFGLCRNDIKYIKSIFPFISSYSCYKEIKNSLFLNNIKVTEDFKLKAVDDNYFKLINLSPVTGDFSSFSKQKSAVVFIPDSFRKKYFGNSPSNGKFAWIGQTPFVIMGSFNPGYLSKDKKNEKSELFSPEKEFYLPLSILDYYFHSYGKEPEFHEISGAVIKLDSTDSLKERKDLVEAAIRKRHGGISDFEISAPLELLKKSQKTQEIFNLVMLLIASISLLIGGIGIMNIMLANVMERTREIGIHRAVGATKKDVVMNFVMESLILSFGGGLIGILLGVSTSKIISLYTGWHVIVSFWDIIFGLVISLLIGAFFGIYPAYRAASIDPVEALRYE